MESEYTDALGVNVEHSSLGIDVWGDEFLDVPLARWEDEVNNHAYDAFYLECSGALPSEIWG